MVFAGHFLLFRIFEIIPPCRIRFIHFYFELVENSEHVQTFQLPEINFRSVENTNFPVITLQNFFFFNLQFFFIHNDKPKNTNSAAIHKHSSIS